MESFDAALANVLQAEGGYVDNPLDRGGPTNFGITLSSWAAYHGRPGSILDIVALTPETVAPIYRELFWAPLNLDSLPNDLALAIFNQAVLRGPTATVKTIQRVLGVKSDGIMGPITIRAANEHYSHALIIAFLRASHEALLHIATSSPEQLIFLRGWSNRIFNLIELIIKRPQTLRD